MRRVISRGALFALLLGGISFHAVADKGDKYTMNINITGTVVDSSSCSFTQSDEKEVNFGDVKLKTENGQNKIEGTYKKTLDSNMKCTGGIDGGTQMMLKSNSGDPVTWQGEKLLPVNNSSGKALPSLGIHLLVNGNAQDMDTWFDVDMQSQPKLEAELLQTGDGKDFSNGEEFTASATLTMAFN